jgi:hypothetical protein
MLVSMPIRCRQCAANNNSGNHFCLTCGADLAESLEQPAPPPISRSSFVRLTAEPTSRLSYPLQGEISTSHAGRYFVLVFFSLAVAVTGWQWRNPRTLGRFRNGPATNQSEMTNSGPAPIAAPSEMLKPGSAHPEPAELASKHSQSATEETSSRDGVAAAPGSKVQVQPASASTRGSTLEIDGEKYLYGDGVAPDCDRAQKDFLAAAKRSSAKAQRALGAMYATGHCAIRDLPLAYRWFARAQRQNPRNRIIEGDMRVLWNQMSPEERKLAVR